MPYLRAGEGYMLFNKHSILDVLPAQKQKLKEEIQSLKADYLLSGSEQDLVASLIEEFTLNVPTIDESKIEMDYCEKQIDVRGDPNRRFFDHSGPFYVAGTEFTFILTFTGDAAFFDVQPQNFTYSSSGSRAVVHNNEINFTYAGANLNPGAAKREFQNELQLIRQNLQNLKSAIDRHNSELEQEIRQQVTQRKQKLLNDAHMAASLGYPMTRREGVPTTYAVPVQRRTLKIAPPPASSSSFKPEPALAMEEYENILGIIRNMVQVMERSPKAFENMGEEDLRTHFLVQLNSQYEGGATGETFNFQGKTDILIRADGRNVFIAECKFWGGEKQFQDTIDQLLSYLSWRDTKTALIIFNRNANFSDVLKKITEIAPKHKCQKRTLASSGESNFRHVFHQPNDRNREIIITVMAFDVPTAEHRTK
jgi:hypothetical protein